MTTLSPAAQAVLHAFKAEVELTWLTKDPEQVGLAAALRAAANQVVPEDYTEAYDCCLVIMQEIRFELLAIATELEAQP